MLKDAHTLANDQSKVMNVTQSFERGVIMTSPPGEGRVEHFNVICFAVSCRANNF